MTPKAQPAYAEAKTTEGRVATKYRNRKTEYGGVTWDSAGEAEYARHLDMLKAAGHIHDWGRGYRIELLPAIAIAGGKATRTVYVPDFFVKFTPQMVAYFIEFKGVQTAVFRLKMRLLKNKHPNIRVLLVTKDGGQIWV